jgi:hypothetical protein
MAISTIGQAGLNAPLSLTLPVVATTMGVGGATPSGSGSGITFPATQSASSDANTLDDYEEGTFTPVLSRDSANTVTYTQQYGKYTKIGNMVYVYITLSWSANTGGSGTYRITGLPFASFNDATNYYPALSLTAMSGITFPASTTVPSAQVYANTTYAKWLADGSATAANGISTVAASGYINMQGVYQSAT